MGSELFELVITALAAWGVARLISRRIQRPSEPEPGDYAGFPARLRPRPNAGAGAIALAEPDEDDGESSYHAPRYAHHNKV